MSRTASPESPIKLSWIPVIGSYDFSPIGGVQFKGAPLSQGSEEGMPMGLAICDQRFAGGTIEAKIVFSEVNDKSACDLVLWYHPEKQYFVSAGLARETLFSIRHFDGKWTPHVTTGDGRNLEANRPYHLRVQLRGSRVTLSVDGVDAAAATLPFTLPPSQVGIFCRGAQGIQITDYTIASETPRVFVVTEFKSPFDELHREVLKVICKEFALEAVRADETFGPGFVIADIERQIDEAKFVIAEITPPNPNVYYEVGYARARNKPTILLADRRLDRLPFDVSPFRTLFYENTIDGKGKIEEALRRHIRAILSQSGF